MKKELSFEEKQELKKEFWKNEKRLNGRKATKEERVQLRRRNREIFGMFCKGDEKNGN